MKRNKNSDQLFTHFIELIIMPIGIIVWITSIITLSFKYKESSIPFVLVSCFIVVRFFIETDLFHILEKIYRNGISKEVKGNMKYLFKILGYIMIIICSVIMAVVGYMLPSFYTESGQNFGNLPYVCILLISTLIMIFGLYGTVRSFCLTCKCIIEYNEDSINISRTSAN